MKRLGTEAQVQLIESLYKTFNAKDLDGLLRHYHPDVEYVNEPKHIHLKSLQDLSAQWRTHAGKVGIELTPQQVFAIPGGVFSQVREVLRTPEGEVFFDGLVGHAYQIEGDLIRRCDILEPDAYVDGKPSRSAVPTD
nr:nuclear transport factor 2 family protein [Hyphomonas sp. Mor2]